MPGIFDGKKESTMKLVTLKHSEWQQVAPYVDTLILPVYQVEIQEKRLYVEKGKQLERVVSTLENRLAGRVLLLPAISYIGHNRFTFSSYMMEVVKAFSQSGFTYLILVVDGTIGLDEEWNHEEGQLLKTIHISLQLEDQMTSEEIEDQVGNIYQQILDIWQNVS
jgi:hypothetical protein